MVAVAGACCRQPEPYPDWIGRTGLALSPSLGRVVGAVVLRPGHLERHPDALAHLAARLRPLDIVAVRAEGHLSQALVPGLFGHVAIYLGTEAELRSLGAWDDPRIVPHHTAIRSGSTFVEADRKGVHLSRPGAALAVDAAAILRPLVGRKRRASVTGAVAGALGTPFDFQFDADDGSCLFCTELVARSLPELDLPRREVYGRRTILPDEVAYRAARGIGRLSLVTYVTASRRSWEKGSARGLRLALDAEWSRIEARRAGS